jgi:hypothetical protein
MNSKYILRNEREDGSYVEVAFSETTLVNVLSHVEDFLKASGFVFNINEHLDIVDDFTTKEEEE